MNPGAFLSARYFISENNSKAIFIKMKKNYQNNYFDLYKQIIYRKNHFMFFINS